MPQLEVTLEICKILAIFAAGIGVPIVIVKTAAGIVVSVTQSVAEFKFVGTQQALQIKELQVQVAKIGELIISMAVEKTRLDNHGERMVRLEKLIDDMRRGEGYILPLNRGAFETPPGRG